MTRLRSRLACRLAVLTVATTLAASSSAQTPPERRVQTLLEGATADYDNLQLDAASAKLAEAIAAIQQAGLRTKVAADLYMLDGVVRYALSGQDSDALNPFVQALLIDPGAQINPYYATPTLEAVLQRARGLVPARTGPGPLPAAAAPSVPAPSPTMPPAPPLPPTLPGLSGPPAPPASAPVGPPGLYATSVIEHMPPTTARMREPIALTARVPVQVPVARVNLHFRLPGEPRFRPVEMVAQQDGVSFQASIPGSSVTAPRIEYFIEVLDRAGSVLGGAGSSAQPIALNVAGAPSAPPPVASRPNAGGAGGAATGAGAGSGRRSPPPARGARDTTRDGWSELDRDTRSKAESSESFSLGLGAGTGLGLATGSPNAFGDEVDLDPGFALTPTHLSADVGFRLSPKISLVPFLRLQVVTLESGVELEPIVGAKARFFVDTTAPVEFYTVAGVGYGNVRHFVYIADKETYDTTTEGPMHVGAGFGMLYLFSDHFGLNLEGYAMALFGTFSAHVDATAQLYVRF
jgi:hypothetical protein